MAHPDTLNDTPGKARQLVSPRPRNPTIPGDLPIDGEPKWFNTMHMVDILNTLAAPNATIIVAALGSSTIVLNPIVVTNPIEEIRECRNFVAHKSAGTLNRIRTYASGGFSTLSHHLRVKRYGVETFHEWGDCMAAIAETAAQ